MLTHNKIDLRVPEVNHFSHVPLSEDGCKSYKICRKNQYAYFK